MNSWALIERAIRRDGACALVTVAETRGSAPRDAGAQMVVTAAGYHGTIGGGALEWQALAEAQGMLQQAPTSQTSTHSLGPDLGQCCGGQVKLRIESFDQTSLSRIAQLAQQHRPVQQSLYLFGAGHVGRALILALAPLPFAVTWIDERPNAFPAAVPANVCLRDSFDLSTAQPGSIALVMTHSHALDFAITDAALRNADIAHVGLIGSATKRARFEKRLREAGVPQHRIAGLICPIGIPDIRGKEPAIIAASTVAQLVILNEAASAQPAEARCA